MLACRVMSGGRYALVLMAALLGPIESRGQQAGTQQTPAADPYKDNPFEKQYRHLDSTYVPLIQHETAAERQRQFLQKGEGDNGIYWANVQAIHVQFDKAFVTLLEAAMKADPPEAMRLWVQWQLGGQVESYTTPEMIAQVNAAAQVPVNAAMPDFQQAAEFEFDTLAKKCNEGNASVVATYMIAVAREAELLGHGAIPNALQQALACARKAPLKLDFDSKVDATWEERFPTSSAHVRADGIKLTFDPGTDTWFAKHAHLTYLSFEFTKESPSSCDTAYGEVGTTIVDVTAKLTKTPKDSMFIIQIYPNVQEVVERASGFRGGSDGMSVRSCAGRKKARSRIYWRGFVRTGGHTPFQLKLGASDVLTDAASFGNVTYTQTTVVTLHASGGG